VTIDVGTGDGRAVLAAARREPATLAIGLDASASAMAEASRRAAAPARRGGLENARFIVAAAEAPPAELLGLAAGVTVRFPWGSLLRGCLDGEAAVSDGLAGLLAGDGTLDLWLAPSERDGLHLPTEPSEIADAVARTFAGRSLIVVEARPAADDEVRATGSTWARRLQRPATVIRLVRR
jgi:16S rRNA (adenine(1408)-N(1))-methyltransferase